MNTIKLTLLGIMVVLAASLRAQTTFFNTPGMVHIIVNDITYPGDVVIGSLATVVVNSGITVKMKPGSKIIVESGGAVLNVFGTITLDGSFTGNNYWEGIEVRGDQNYIQPARYLVANGTYPGINPNTNGVVRLNNSKIEYALVGVSSSKGGIVYGFGSTFTNCGYALSFNDFNKQLASSFTFCDFERTSTMNTFTPDVAINKTYGVLFNNCEFTTVSIPGFLRYGIDLFEGGATISNCKFTNYSTGVFVGAINSSLRMPLFVSNNSFYDCISGVTIAGYDNIRIKENNFYNINQNAGVGTWFEGSVGFDFYKNNFYNYPSGSSVYNGVSMFRNTGGDIGNMTRYNYYQNCFRPVLALDNNRGLQIKCNDFNTINAATYRGNNIDVYGINGGTVDPNLGIPHQGTLIFNDNIGYHLAGNLFTNRLNATLSTDIRATDDVPDFTYFHHQKVGSARVEPMDIRSPKVGKEESPIATSNTRDQACWLWLSENKPVTIRMGEHIEQRNQLISEGIAANQDQIKYMDQIIAHDVAEYAIDLAEAGDEEALLNFLLTNITRQKRMMLVQYYISMQNYSAATTHLTELANDSTGSDLPHYVNYYTRLINILQANAGEIVMTAADSTYFFEITALNTPVAAKAKVLLGMHLETAEENNLISSNKTITTKVVNITLYPQPAKDELNLIGNVEIFDTYEIYDITMRKITSGKLENTKIDLHLLTNGIYYLHLIGNEIQQAHKIIISK